MILICPFCQNNCARWLGSISDWYVCKYCVFEKDHLHKFCYFVKDKVISEYYILLGSDSIRSHYDGAKSTSITYLSHHRSSSNLEDVSTSKFEEVFLPLDTSDILGSAQRNLEQLNTLKLFL